MQESIDNAIVKELYPVIDENETPLPKFWSSKDKYNFIGLSQNKLLVHYKGIGKTHKDAASVRTPYPIPATCGIYYFEVKIVSKGRDGYMGIGVSSQGVSMNRLPGWDKHSYGYHGDDGRSFCSSGTGQPYGPTFTTNDIIGCGVNYMDNTCFYTKNGVDLGVAFNDLPPNLYPTVGLQTLGETVDTNFGQKPFLFDILDKIKQCRAKVQEKIKKYPVQDSKNEWKCMMQKIVFNYLCHQGYTETARQFGTARGLDLKSVGWKTIENRQTIQRLVLTGHVGRAIELVRELYPDLLEKQRPALHFHLMCRQFVEMIAHHAVGGRADLTPHAIPHSPALKRKSAYARCRRCGQRPGSTPPESIKRRSRRRLPASAVTRSSSSSDDGDCACACCASGHGACCGRGRESSSGGDEDLNGFAAAAASPLPHTGNGFHPPEALTDVMSPAPPLSVANEPQPAEGYSCYCCCCNGCCSSSQFCGYSDQNYESDDASDDMSQDGGGGGGHCCCTTSSWSEASDEGQLEPEERNGTTTRGIKSQKWRRYEGGPGLTSPDAGAEGWGLDLAAIEQILAFGRRLHAMSQELTEFPEASAEERKITNGGSIAKTVQDVFSLLAYEDPYKSPVKELLDPAQREPVCKALNSAILSSTNMAATSTMELCIGQASKCLKLMGKSNLGACAFVRLSDF